MLAAVLELLKSKSAIVKGRAYLFLYMILQHSFEKCYCLLETQLFQEIKRDSSKYEAQCLEYVLITLYQNYDLLIHFTRQEIQNSAHSKLQAKSSSILIIMHMSSTPVFDEIFFKFSNIQGLLGLLDLLEEQPETPSLVYLKNHYLQLLEKIFGNAAINEKLQEEYSEQVLPFLIAKIVGSPPEDVRYSCTKFLLYLVNFYISEECLYDSTVLTATSDRIRRLIVDSLLPRIDSLLQSPSQTIVGMTLKLVSVLFQINEVFIADFYEKCSWKSLLLHYDAAPNANILNILRMFANSSRLSK